MSSDVPAKEASPMMNAVIAFFLVIAFGAWICYSATNGKTDTWGWMIVAALGLIAAVVTGVVAGTND
jgi:ABC-type nickel/cobalt efflux system permease component RcnA